MSKIIYDSGLLDFAANESDFIKVPHNLEKCPPIIQFVGEKNGEVGFPRIIDDQGIEVRGPYLIDTNSVSSIKVYKPNVYTYTGQFRIRIFE